MSQFTFLTVDAFKSVTNTVGQAIDFTFKDPTKLFAICGGKTYKAQATLTVSEPVRFMYSETEGFEKGCFVNVKPLQVKFSL
jgi:hypothetical protein